MTISPSYPDLLQNGTPADATQVMADFYQIQNDVNANAAHNGANSDITSLTGLTTPLSIAQGGTGGSSAGAALIALGAAASGANSDITSLSGLLTPLSIAQGGTGQATATAAFTALAASGGTIGGNVSLTGTLTASVSVVAPLATITTVNATTLTASTTATVPTVAAGDNSTNAASTAFVKHIAAFAWVMFIGTTAVIQASNNVSSVVRNGTGNYTINFTNAAGSGNYATVGMALNTGIGTVMDIQSQASGSVTVQTFTLSGSGTDPNITCVVIFA